MVVLVLYSQPEVAHYFLGGNNLHVNIYLRRCRLSNDRYENHIIYGLNFIWCNSSIRDPSDRGELKFPKWLSVRYAIVAKMFLLAGTSRREERSTGRLWKRPSSVGGTFWRKNAITRTVQFLLDWVDWWKENCPAKYSQRWSITVPLVWVLEWSKCDSRSQIQGIHLL